MAKKVAKKVKVVLPAGKAVPTPQIGPVLGGAGINIGQFLTEFNKATQAMIGETIPAEITVFEDRSYTFILKTPPVSSLILKAIGKDKGSGKPNVSKIGKLTKVQLKAIAEKKMPDLNANDIDAAMRTVAGSARNMGVEVEN